MFVLKFIGGSLPQCDLGNFEYYCCMMLTFFKPWRNGRDLKKKHRLYFKIIVLIVIWEYIKILRRITVIKKF